MNEQLQATMNDMLVNAIEAMEKGAEWMAGEIPQVIEQLLMWKFTVSIIGFGVFATITLLLVGVSIFLLRSFLDKKSWAYQDGSRYTTNEFDVAATISLGVLFIADIISLLFVDLNWLQIWIAPKLYLLEYAADLVR